MGDMKAKLFSDNRATKDPVEYAANLQDANILREVEAALLNKRTLLAFQPIVSSARAGRPVFWEGLVRLRDAQGRILPAADFMMAVEAHELGREIDCASLELGLTELRNFPSLRLAVNLSARSIGNAKWMQILERGLAIDPTIGERLILEITESSVLACGPKVLRFMASLHARGISFALDDFGAGYTSLRQLKDFTFDILKIDGSYIKDVDKDSDGQILVEAIVALAQKFDMLCVAERVERQEEADYLAKIGVDCLQGYHFAVPTLHPEWRDAPITNRRA